MAILDSQEQQQVDAFKAWWKENGKWVLGALALILAGIGVTQGWQSYRHSTAKEASTLYEELEKQLDSNDPKRINDAAAAVMDRFGSSAYGPRAALVAARANLRFNDPSLARTQLQWAMDHASEEGIENIARLQLVTILINEKNLDEAIKLLDSEHPAAYDGLYADLRGDVLAAMGKNDEARSAYQLAYDKLDADSPYRAIVRVKLDGLPAVQ